MRIAATQYTCSTRSVDIYISGCKAPHCKGCHNPELFDFDVGEIFDDAKCRAILSKIIEFDLLVKNVFVYGGEPLDQDHHSLKTLLEAANLTGKPVWLFTKYSLDTVPDAIKSECAYIKCGRYDETKQSSEYSMYDIKLASTNQRIYKKGKDY